LGHGLAFLDAEGDFAQAVIDFDGQVEGGADGDGGVVGAGEGRGDDGGDAAVAQQVGGGDGLVAAAVVERDVDVALGEVLGVPVGFAVAEEPERDGVEGQVGGSFGLVEE